MAPSFANAKLLTPTVPVNSSQHHQRTIIPRRSPALETRTSKTPSTSAQIAISTQSLKLESNPIRPLPGPTHSTVLSQANFASQPKVAHLTPKGATDVKFSALPKDLTQNAQEDRHTSDADLSDLRGLFTGKVRQRIANARHYPRTARRRGMEGQPVISFTLDKEGQLMEVDLAQTSGYQLLDQAAVEAVHQAAPYPEIPAELQTDTFRFKLPISFVLK